ncbi:MAG: hypothetical protein KatS3mg118_3237 [Paracoccaceae bacterium]|nr:MAG: hypothetical protein KatS3mg118_3237 [Paracoccaceae bacterium]
MEKVAKPPMAVRISRLRPKRRARKPVSGIITTDDTI